MKTRNILIAFILLVIGIFNLQGQTYHQGVPLTFVPATLQALSNQSHVRMSYGTMANPGQTLGYSTTNNKTHEIITFSSQDQKACLDGIPGVFLNTMPPTDILPDWDEEMLGPMRVMRLGDAQQYGIGYGGGGEGFASSRITYHFIHDSMSNVILVYFAFVAQSPGHGYQDNPFFRIDVLTASGQPAIPGAKNSHFLVNPASKTGDPNPPVNPENSIDEKDYFDCSSYSSKWTQWLPVAFDLRNRIGEQVKLQITTQDCPPSAHWAYGYFTARGFRGRIEVEACGDDDIKLTVPKGFDNYVWKCGGVPLATAATNELMRKRNVNETEYTCDLTSMTGAVMTFSATVTYYELEPNFEYSMATDSCKYDVWFENTSVLTIVNNGGNSPQEIKYVEWDFGDGKPKSTLVAPKHEYDNPGVYDVKLTLYDNDKKCVKDTTIKVNVTPLNPCESTDTLYICEGKFPYNDAKYGHVFNNNGPHEIEFPKACASGCDSTVWVYVMDNLPHCEGHDTVYVCKESFPYTHPSGNVFNTPGTFPIMYEGACGNGCDSTLHLRIIEVVPKVTIGIEGDFCDEFTAELFTITESEVASYIWNTGDFSDRITVTEPGQYSVTITDDNACKANNHFKVPACLPNIVLPTAISPSDQNGINDFFYLPQVALIENAEVMIYDRFGTLVFYSKDKNFVWDGSVNGKPVYAQTYNYILFVTDYNGITTRHTGVLGVY